MPDDQQQANTKIAELEKHQAVLDVKLDNIGQGITEIKTNHLVHINDQLTNQSKAISDMPLMFTKMLADEMGKIYADINALKRTEAGQQPQFNLINKVLEYIILAVVGAVIAFVIMKR